MKIFFAIPTLIFLSLFSTASISSCEKTYEENEAAHKKNIESKFQKCGDKPKCKESVIKESENRPFVNEYINCMANQEKNKNVKKNGGSK